MLIYLVRFGFFSWVKRHRVTALLSIISGAVLLTLLVATMATSSNSQPPAFPTVSPPEVKTGLPSEAPFTSLIVTNPLDDGSVSTPGTLSYAIDQATDGQLITFAVNGRVVTLKQNLAPLKPGVQMVGGSCDSPVTLDALSSVTEGLILSGRNKLDGLNLLRHTAKTGWQIKAPAETNTLNCVKVSYSSEYEDDWSLPAATAKNANTGYYQYPDGATRVPGTAAELVDLRWKDINPQDGVYDWSKLRLALNNTKNGVWLRWRLTDTIHVPAWIRQKYSDIGVMRYPYDVPYKDADPDNEQLSQGDFVEVWRAGYITEFRKLMQAFRNEGFASNPKLRFSYFPGGWKWSEFDLNFAPQMEARGLTPQAYLSWFKQHVEDWISGFGEENRYKLVFTGVDEIQSASDNQNWSQTIDRQMNQYAVQRGLGARDGLTEMFNFVLTDVPNWGTSTVMVGNTRYMVTNDQAPFLTNPNLIFGTENECFTGCGYSVSETMYYQAMKLGYLKSLQLRMNWVNTSELHQDVLKYPVFFRWLELSLGKQVSQSPDAWVALREGYDKANKWWVSNFERWLYQRDNVLGGKTVKVEPVEWAAENGTSYEARRTDHASGNDYIYFGVADNFIKGDSQRVQIKVTYLDNFSGKWGLDYFSSGSNSLKRADFEGNNTGGWKTITFDLTNVSFNNQAEGGMDFRLANNNSNDLTVRFVRVVKLP